MWHRLSRPQQPRHQLGSQGNGFKQPAPHRNSSRSRSSDLSDSRLFMQLLLVIVLAQALTEPQHSSENSAEQLRSLLASEPENAEAREKIVNSYLASKPDEAERYTLCLEFANTQQFVPVTIELRNSWGERIPGVLVEAGVAKAIIPLTLSLPSCLPYVLVRLPGGTEDHRAPVEWRRSGSEGFASVQLPGPSSFWELSGVGQVSWVYPGWREGPKVHASGGVRLSTWRHWLQADFALKVSSFASPYWSIPGNPSVDAFVAFPLTFDLANWQLRASLGVGVWSTVCPSARLAIIGAKGRFVAGVTTGVHLYPLAFKTLVATYSTSDVPFAYYLFWDIGLSFGIRFE